MIKQLFPGIALFSSLDGRPYATCKLSSGIRSFALGSKSFRQLVQRNYFQTHGDPIKPDELKGIIQAA